MIQPHASIIIAIEGPDTAMRESSIAVRERDENRARNDMTMCHTLSDACHMVTVITHNSPFRQVLYVAILI